MKYLIKAPEERLRASVQLPASKSISNRALILNALSYSPYDIQNLSDCDDTEVMVKALNSDSRDFDITARSSRSPVSGLSVGRTTLGVDMAGAWVGCLEASL